MPKQQEVLQCPPHALLPLYRLGAQVAFPFLPFLLSPPLGLPYFPSRARLAEALTTIPQIARIPVMIVYSEKTTFKPSELR